MVKSNEQTTHPRVENGPEDSEVELTENGPEDSEVELTENGPEDSEVEFGVESVKSGEPLALRRVVSVSPRGARTQGRVALMSACSSVLEKLVSKSGPLTCIIPRRHSVAIFQYSLRTPHPIDSPIKNGQNTVCQEQRCTTASPVIFLDLSGRKVEVGHIVATWKADGSTTGHFSATIGDHPCALDWEKLPLSPASSSNTSVTNVIPLAAVSFDVATGVVLTQHKDTVVVVTIKPGGYGPGCSLRAAIAGISQHRTDTGQATYEERKIWLNQGVARDEAITKVDCSESAPGGKYSTDLLLDGATCNSKTPCGLKLDMRHHLGDHLLVRCSYDGLYPYKPGECGGNENQDIYRVPSCPTTVFIPTPGAEVTTVAGAEVTTVAGAEVTTVAGAEVTTVAGAEDSVATESWYNSSIPNNELDATPPAHDDIWDYLGEHPRFTLAIIVGAVACATILGVGCLACCCCRCYSNANAGCEVGGCCLNNHHPDDGPSPGGGSPGRGGASHEMTVLMEDGQQMERQNQGGTRAEANELGALFTRKVSVCYNEIDADTTSDTCPNENPFSIYLTSPTKTQKLESTESQKPESTNDASTRFGQGLARNLGGALELGVLMASAANYLKTRAADLELLKKYMVSFCVCKYKASIQDATEAAEILTGQDQNGWIDTIVTPTNDHAIDKLNTEQLALKVGAIYNLIPKLDAEEFSFAAARFIESLSTPHHKTVSGQTGSDRPYLVMFYALLDKFPVEIASKLRRNIELKTAFEKGDVDVATRVVMDELKSLIGLLEDRLVPALSETPIRHEVLRKLADELGRGYHFGDDNLSKLIDSDASGDVDFVHRHYSELIDKLKIIVKEVGSGCYAPFNRALFACQPPGRVDSPLTLERQGQLLTDLPPPSSEEGKAYFESTMNGVAGSKYFEFKDFIEYYYQNYVDQSMTRESKEELISRILASYGYEVANKQGWWKTLTGMFRRNPAPQVSANKNFTEGTLNVARQRIALADAMTTRKVDWRSRLVNWMHDLKLTGIELPEAIVNEITFIVSSGGSVSTENLKHIKNLLINEEGLKHLADYFDTHPPENIEQLVSTFERYSDGLPMSDDELQERLTTCIMTKFIILDAPDIDLRDVAKKTKEVMSLLSKQGAAITSTENGFISLLTTVTIMFSTLYGAKITTNTVALTRRFFQAYFDGNFDKDGLISKLKLICGEINYEELLPAAVKTSELFLVECGLPMGRDVIISHLLNSLSVGEAQIQQPVSSEEVHGQPEVGVHDLSVGEAQIQQPVSSEEVHDQPSLNHYAYALEYTILSTLLSSTTSQEHQQPRVVS